MARPNVGIATPSERHWRILDDVAARGQARGPRLMDAHLAALAIEHGATLATTDRGFARFPELRLRETLAGRRPGGEGVGGLAAFGSVSIDVRNREATDVPSRGERRDAPGTAVEQPKRRRCGTGEGSDVIIQTRQHGRR